MKSAFDRYYAWRLGEFTKGFPVLLDYPVRPEPRHILGQSPHPLLDRWFQARREACFESLRVFEEHRRSLESIPLVTDDPLEPMWHQGWFSVLDGMAAYAFVANRRPKHIIEVGSGNSTKFMARAIRDLKLETRLVSVDPQPRAEVDALCSQVLRQPFESIDLRQFHSLSAGDILFIDNSHRVFTNSDVTVFFTEVLPVLQRGVIVHIHDVFLPWDYPVEWSDRYYSEQYLLAAWLLAGPERLKLLISNAFVSFDGQLRSRVEQVWSNSALKSVFAPSFRYGGVERLLGVSFWAEIV